MKSNSHFTFILFIFLVVFLTLNVSAERLPIVGGDDDAWGTILNDYLSTALGDNATTLNISDYAIFNSGVNITGDLHMEGAITHNSPVSLRDGLEIVIANGSGWQDAFHIFPSNSKERAEAEHAALTNETNNSLIFFTHNLANPYNMGYIFFNDVSNRSDFVINHDGTNRSSIFDRSLQIGKSLGNAPIDENYTLCQGFNLIDCNTTGTGADLGVEDDIEAKGSIYSQENINATGNFSLGQKIVFTLGEIIDNIADGWIRITGGLNVTQNLTVDSGTLFVDSNNNRVGIGTTSPTTELEVVGDITSKGTSWTSRTSAADNDWLSVTYGNGLFVAVASNAVMTSPDGITWTNRSSAANINWFGVTYGNGLFVVVGWGGGGNRVMTSPNGINWTSRTSASNADWLGVAYGNGVFVAVSTNDEVMTSPDGITWTNQTGAVSNEWISVTYGNDLFVAVSYTGTGNRVMTSPDGINWTSQTSASDNNWRSVTYGNGLFVAVSNTGTNRVMNSLDGITWTNRTAAIDNNWNSVTYGNGLFVAVATNGTGNRVMTSPDSITWTTRSSVVDNQWKSITYGNGVFVTVSSSGSSDRVMTSGKSEINVVPTNNIYQGGFEVRGNLIIDNTTLFVNSTNDRVGINTTTPQNLLNVLGDANITGTLYRNEKPLIDWEEATNGTLFLTSQWNATNTSYLLNTGDTATGNYTFDTTTLFVDSDNDRVGIGTTSPTTELEVVGDITSKGTSWTNRTSASDNSWRSVTYGNGRFVAVSNSGSGNRVMTSPDGITWTNRTTPVDNNWDPVTYGNGIFVAVAGNGSGNRVMTSPDGITWTNRISASDNEWRGITYGNGLFVAVSSSGPGDLVMTSPDGITWTNRISASDNQWYDVTYGNGLFVAVANTGSDNKVMTSPDGITWTNRTSAAAGNTWVGVTYGNGLFVAISDSGASLSNRVMTSSDGITWTGRTAASGNLWNNIIYGNGLFVAVSANGAGDRVMTSPDGITWTSRTSSSDNSWHDVTYGNGIFVAVSTDGFVMTSGKTERNIVSHNNIYQGGLNIFGNVGIGTTSPTTELEVVGDITSKGTKWTIRNSTENSTWLSVVYGNGLFVAVSQGGTNRVATSPDGVTWTSRSVPAGNWDEVVYGNGLFVAVSSAATSNDVMTSSNGVNWAATITPTGKNWRGVTYSNGLFVAVANGGTAGNRVMTSPDGITWTNRTSASDNGWNSITYSNGLFVAVATTGTNRVMTSSDGINWTNRTSADENNGWVSVTYGNGLFVAVALDRVGAFGQVMTSPNGINWTIRSNPTGGNWRGVTYGDGLFVAVGDNGTGNRVMTSPNGINWTSRTSAADNGWNNVAYGNGVFVAFAWDGDGNRVMTSGKLDINVVPHNNIFQGGMEVRGDLNITGGISVGVGGTFMSNIQADTIGDCTAGDTGTSGSVFFSTAFTAAPIVMMTVDESADQSGCTSVRLSARNTTAFSWQSWTGGTETACDCIHWMAIGV